jgi:hypothetical protein
MREWTGEWTCFPLCGYRLEIRVLIRCSSKPLGLRAFVVAQKCWPERRGQHRLSSSRSLNICCVRCHIGMLVCCLSIIGHYGKGRQGRDQSGEDRVQLVKLTNQYLIPPIMASTVNSMTQTNAFYK